jgi:outer membrane biosynthesis protein TonB
MTTSTRRMPLPRPLRASVMTEMEPAFAAVVAASLLLHVAMVLYLRGVDWPRRPELEETVAPLVQQRWPPPPHRAQMVPTPVEAPVRPQAPAPRSAPRRALAGAGSRPALLQVLSALGEGSALRDLLRRGSVDRGQEDALRGVSGLTLAEERALVPPPDGGGRRAELAELRAGTRISRADVSAAPEERRVARVHLEPPATESSGFDPHRLAGVIREHLGEVRACYERALKRRPELAGKLLLRFVLTAAGTVSALELDEDTLHDDEVSGCVRAVARSWRFPAPGRAVEVAFPFLFQPGA